MECLVTLHHRPATKNTGDSATLLEIQILNTLLDLGPFGPGKLSEISRRIFVQSKRK